MYAFASSGESFNSEAISTPGTPEPRPASLWETRPPSSFDYQLAKDAHDTDRGLLLLAIGLVIEPIPVIGLLGLGLALIGAIFVMTGRGAFGERHSKYVLLAAVVYLIGFIILFSIGLSIEPDIQSVFQSTTNPATLSARLSDLIYGYLIAVAAIGVVVGLATVVFTYAIQNRRGKILLWLSFSISILLAVPGFILASQLRQSVFQAISTSDPSPLYDVINQGQALRVLGIVPAIFYAIAYLNARSRITEGQIP